MDLPNQQSYSSPAQSLVASTAGIRVVLWETNEGLRTQIRSALQREVSFTLVGDCRDWGHCAHLLDETVPELLIAPLLAIPAQWWSSVSGTSSFPLVLGLCAIPSPVPLERRVIQILAPPLENSAIASALARAQSRIYTQKAQELSYLLRQYTAGSATPSMSLASITVDHEGRKLHLDTRTIVAVQADANYCRLHTANGVYHIRETMNGLCTKLDPTLFVRIHRSVIINVSRVGEVKVSHNLPTSVVLQDGTELPVGPHFRQSLQELNLQKRA